MIKLITKTDRINNVYSKFKKVYNGYKKDYEFSDGKNIGDILKQLKKPNLTEDEITKIIGNNSWTRNTCYECNEDVFAIIQLGEEPNWDSATVQICPDCLNKVKILIDNSK